MRKSIFPGETDAAKCCIAAVQSAATMPEGCVSATRARYEYFEMARQQRVLIAIERGIEMNEKTFFEYDGVKVTNARFIVDGQTFAMSNVTSGKVCTTRA